MPAERFAIDSIRVTADEALELMAYHLVCAQRLFEAVGEVGHEREELKRLLRRDDAREDPPEVLAGLAFYDRAVAVYEGMRVEDEAEVAND